jgi:GAF domain-containing protein
MKSEMTAAFWIDVAAWSLTTLVATALMLVVLGTDLRRLLNISFGLLMAAVGVWAATAVILRFALLLDAGTQQFWMEFSTLFFMLIAPLLLVFSAVYIQTARRWPYIVAIASVALIGLFCIPLFSHQVVFDVHLEPNGIVDWDRTAFSYFTSLPLFASAALALVLLWSERRRLKEHYLTVAITILVVGGLVFSLLPLFVPLSFPTLSLVMIVVSAIMGYGVLNRQLFNPVRELTGRLEEQVAQRTQELERVAGERQQALLRVQQHVAYLQIAAEVARSVAAIRDTDQLLSETARLIAEHFGFYHVGIFLTDEADEYAVLQAASSEGGRQMLARGYRLRVGEAGTVGHVAATGRPRVALDVGEGAISFNSTDLPWTRSEMAAPLRVHKRVIGVLDVQSTESAAFTEESLAVLQTIADQLAVGLENSRLFAETQAALQEMEATHRRYLQQAWTEYLQTREKTVYESDRPDAAPLGNTTLPEIEQAVERQSAVALTGDDTAEGRSALVTPVALRGEVIGVLGIHDEDGTRQWSADEIALAEGIAERMALAADNLRLLDETQRRAAREQLIGQIASRIREALNMDTVLQTAVREIGQAFKLHDVTIQLETDADQTAQ